MLSGVRRCIQSSKYVHTLGTKYCLSVPVNKMWRKTFVMKVVALCQDTGDKKKGTLNGI
jgi:hypothetical protein